jgi:hypothetical protein
MSKKDRYSEKEFTCPMCGGPIDLDTDDTADEDGHVMHAECYFKRVADTSVPRLTITTQNKLSQPVLLILRQRCLRLFPPIS